MRRPGRAGLAALLAGVLLAGCGVGAEDEARPLEGNDAPMGVLAPPVGSAQPAGGRVEQLLFVRDQRLERVDRPAVEVTPQSALADLLAGPLSQERERGLTSALPSGGGGLLQVEVRDSLALVSVDPDLLDSGRSDQVLALAQVVATLDALPEVRGVQFLSQGEVLPVPRADGAVVQRPLTVEDYRDLLAPR